VIVTIDFETLYSKDYSLRKLSEVDYILDPRFEVILCAIKLSENTTVVYDDPASIRDALGAIDWEHSAFLSHNVRFDGAIAAWHYGVRPKLWLDTLSMARAVSHAWTGSSSLASVAKYMDLPAKGDAVVRAMGMTRAAFSAAELAEYAEYCKHDTDLCREIFDRFRVAGAFPTDELLVIDLSLRMFIEPQARLNPMKLAEQLHLIKAEKAAAFARMAHINKDVFSSNNKFAELLQTLGVDPPRKLSTTTGLETWALARNDREFKELCADESLPMDVQAALACRMGAKSTIDETRTETLLGLSRRDWGTRGTAWMPVPYKYYGAHTGRFSGDGGYNFANLRRGAPIRDAIEAPPGYRIVHRDASQIEARILAWLAGCDDLLAAFAEGRDVYCEFATRFYGRDITRGDKVERHLGKQAVLSLGYGAGAERFRHSLFVGTGGMSVTLDIDEAQVLVDFYRDTYAPIPNLWRTANGVLKRMIREPMHPPRNGLPAPLEVGQSCVWLPNNLAIQYPKLHIQTTPEGAEDMYFQGSYGPRKIYGAKLIENVTQGLARIAVTDIMRRVYQHTGHWPFMSTYDSHDYMVPEHEAGEMDATLAQVFAEEPAWAPGLPFASEGGWGKTLLEAEKGANR
jgi:DNA polymerase